ncbi:MAG: ATP-binding protein [Oligoflexia bacterium]|nr:ATP-binding protein [Oligoflexia bacterium]
MKRFEKDKPRYILDSIAELALKRHKMAFISGPRQCGKTTVANILKDGYDESKYFNWDQSEFKKRWTKNPDQITQDFNLNKEKFSRLMILDEIHKSKNWKQKIKGIFDLNSKLINIIVTGSARLNVYRRGSDSLMGRYLLFRLHPFSLRELIEIDPATPEECYKNLFIKKHSLADSKSKIVNTTLIDLFNYSGFPEPLMSRKKNILNIWKRGRKEKIVKEDLRDLTQVKDINLIDVLTNILPEKIGSPLSVQSLREDLEVSHDTVSRWLAFLEELYFFFKIKPYSKSIARTLKKESKIYLFDWTDILSEGAKFENLIACHLQKACNFWEDTGEGDFTLYYLRNKDKKEVDFLITKDKHPWFSVECKYKNTSLDLNYKTFQGSLNCPHIQVVYEEGIFRKIDDKTWIISADYFLLQFV